MKLEALPWLILFLPLLAAGIITLFTLRDRKLSATLSIGAVLISFFSRFFWPNSWPTTALQTFRSTGCKSARSTLISGCISIP